ncbi:MAG: DUF881 domain-containing protein [Firmicutes bacterium]|nr:DUF881 domain-containing protein [Bacillota bacterium]
MSSGDRRLKGYFDPWMAGLIAVMLINVIVLALSAQQFRRPAGARDLAAVRQGAAALADFYTSEIAELGLENNQAVREAVAKYRYALEQAITVDEVARAMSTHGRNLADVIRRENQLELERKVLGIINQEPGITTAPEGAAVTVHSENGQVLIEDPADILSPETEAKLKASDSAKQLKEMVQIEIRSGNPKLLTTRSLPGQIQALRQEIESTRVLLQQAMQAGGYAELTGPGLIIRARQGQEQALIDNVLGYDLRDIVNELFAAGARGIQIGSQRLVATSSIRAAGSHLLVNHQAIPTEPVEIKVVGDPEVLASALDLIIHSPYFGLTLNIEKQDSITLTAHPLE